jgi:hypothetical protein
MTGSSTRRDPAKDPLAFERVPHIVMDPPRHRSIAMPPYRALLLRTNSGESALAHDAAASLASEAATRVVSY